MSSFLAILTLAGALIWVAPIPVVLAQQTQIKGAEVTTGKARRAHTQRIGDVQITRQPRAQGEVATCEPASHALCDEFMENCNNDGCGTGTTPGGGYSCHCTNGEVSMPGAFKTN